LDSKWKERLSQLRDIKRKTLLGDQGKVGKIHAKGKLTARERLELLLDPGSFTESNMLVENRNDAAGDGITVGHGTIEGRVVCVYAQDPMVFGGSIGALHGYKMYRTVERAATMGVPFIGLHDSPGARALRIGTEGGWDSTRIREEKSGVSLFYPNTQASGVIPQISAIMGSCAGISVYSPALTDFVFMVDGTSQMFITGPKVTKSAVGENITAEQLGGAEMHAKVSGVADFRMPNEEECLLKIRELISFLPSNNKEEAAIIAMDDSPERMVEGLEEIVPSDPYKPYDMHEVIARIFDSYYFLEVKEEFAPEIIVGFARLDGRSVGVIANQPLYRAGALTIDSSDKQARFIRFCDCFNLPVILLVDTPAYLPGTAQEHGGIIRHGAKVLYALCEATVPRIAVVLRKSYGGGNLGMGVSPGLATDMVYAWPISEIGVFGAEQAVDLFFNEEIKKAENPAVERRNKIKEYQENYANPIAMASEVAYIEDIIEPMETRRVLIRSFQLLKGKNITPKYHKKHGNIPL
jgi:acetyl-CoA carboxylase carboxyltransferase component